MTLLIIYLSGVFFFLLQAYRYARIGKQRIIGALTWPILILCLPQLINAYLVMTREAEKQLRFDERGSVKCLGIGKKDGEYRWGIGM